MRRTPGNRPSPATTPLARPDARKAPRYRAEFDLLEPRILPSGVFASYGVPPVAGIDHYGPLISADDGTLAFEEAGTAANVGALLGRVDAEGAVTQVPLTTADGKPVADAPIQVTGLDGNFWGVKPGVGGGDAQVDQVTPDGVVTWFDAGVVAGPGGGAEEIATGDDVALWFAAGSSIGRITLDGVASSYPIPAGSDAREVVSGPDGAIYFTGKGTVGRMADDGTVTLSTLPADSASVASIPHAPAFDGNGDLWFLRGDAADELTPDGKIARFPISWADDRGAADGLDPGIEAVSSMIEATDGGLWFAVPGRASLGRIAPDGSTALVPLADGSTPGPVVQGFDGPLWYADSRGSAIGQVRITESLDAYGAELDLSTSPDFAGMVGGFFDPNLAAGDPGDPSAYSTSIDWGDGSKSPGVVTSNGDGSFAVSGTHAFATQGPYTITISLSGPAPSSSALPAPAASVVSGEASVAPANLPAPPETPDPGVIFENGDATSGSPIGIAPPSPPSASTSSFGPVIDPVVFQGPIDFPATGSEVSPAAPVVATLTAGPASAPTAIPAATGIVGPSSATIPATTAGPATAYPLVPDSSASSASAGSTTPRGPRASVTMANASLRPVASALAPKASSKRPRRQARPRPVGPRVVSATAPPQVMPSPDIRANPGAR